MRTIADFSGEARQKASDRLRLVDHTNALKVGYKPSYWSVPFLLRLIDRVDETIVDSPKQAVGLAEGLPNLADRIPLFDPPERVEEIFYTSEREALGFRAWSRSVLASALCAVGRFEEAAWQTKRALSLAISVPRFARADVLRRSALVELSSKNFDRAAPMASEAIRLFSDLGDRERLALARIGLGNLLHLRDGPGAAVAEFAEAIRCAAGVRSRRSERAIVIAATNLGMCASLSATADMKEAYSCVRMAIRMMNQRRYPLEIPKLMVRWTEAILAYRFGSSRYALRWLRKVRDGFLQRAAYRQAICCIVDLLTIAKDQGAETLQEAADECVAAMRRAIRDSTPEESLAQVFEAWADHPTDVESLRRVLGRNRIAAKS